MAAQLKENPKKGLTVIRRCGEPTSFEADRIRQVINWACEGISVNPLELESRFNEKLTEGISTKKIQESLTHLAFDMCSPEATQWSLVSARLKLWGLYKDVKVSRGYGYYLDDRIVPFKKPQAATSYAIWVDYQVTNKKYDERLNNYSLSELEEAGSWIVPDRDKDFYDPAMNLLINRYLLPNELPQEAILSCALLLALPEKTENRLKVAKQFYDKISLRKLSLATPILANLRRPNGQLGSCFIIVMDDNLESIFREITNTARISKNGGGVGVCLSRVRATGSWVKGYKNASGGVISWIKLLNDTGVGVNQLGKRAGAITTGIDIWHLDVPEFLEMQTENGDQRRKAYDVFPQLILPDEFMRRVINKETWTLVDPYEVRTNLGIELADLWGEEFEKAYQQIELELGKKITLYKRINARELFKSIMRSQVETGMPYLAFKDTINRANPNKHEGMIPQTNLCCESYSNVTTGNLAHSCNLTSINLANIEFEELAEICSLAVRLLDNTIELTEPPFPDAKAHNDLYRTIGVGFMGLADYLAKNRLKYRDLNEIDRLFEEAAYHCTKTSMELAKERESYGAFEGSEWHLGNIGNILPSSQKYLSDPNSRWSILREDIMKFGIRNSHITAIAPNTSSSLVQGCTASFLPPYKRFYVDKNGDGINIISVPFPEYWWFYEENVRTNQKHVVAATSTIQGWIDTGISMELLFDLNEGVYWPDEPERCIQAKDIYETLIMAWELGCKAVYYIRSVQKDSFKENSCESCAN